MISRYNQHSPLHALRSRLLLSLHDQRKAQRVPILGKNDIEQLEKLLRGLLKQEPKGGSS